MFVAITSLYYVLYKPNMVHKSKITLYLLIQKLQVCKQQNKIVVHICGYKLFIPKLGIQVYRCTIPPLVAQEAIR